MGGVLSTMAPAAAPGSFACQFPWSSMLPLRRPSKVSNGWKAVSPVTRLSVSDDNNNTSVITPINNLISLKNRTPNYLGEKICNSPTKQAMPTSSIFNRCRHGLSMYVERLSANKWQIDHIILFYRWWQFIRERWPSANLVTSRRLSYIEMSNLNIKSSIIISAGCPWT